MDVKLKIVMRLPLRELWRDDGFLTSTRGRSLTNENIRNFLAAGPVQFVVADLGSAPRWIPTTECLQFWKDEVQPHLASELRVSLDAFQGGYCYFASQ